jgi:hypothetical protein
MNKIVALAGRESIDKGLTLEFSRPAASQLGGEDATAARPLAGVTMRVRLERMVRAQRRSTQPDEAVPRRVRVWRRTREREASALCQDHQRGSRRTQPRCGVLQSSAPQWTIRASQSHAPQRRTNTLLHQSPTAPRIAKRSSRLFLETRSRSALPLGRPVGSTHS